MGEAIALTRAHSKVRAMKTVMTRATAKKNY
jgi:hypothetical protein